MKIFVLGAGYVGLVTGACFADRGHEVTCVDSDPAKIASIRRGVTPFHEVGLDEILSRTVGTRLFAQTDLTGAEEAELIFICVGTPFKGGSIDLSQVVAAAGEIGAVLRQKGGYQVVVVKSTVVPGTTDQVVRERLEGESGLSAGRDFGLGMNPEFLTEGCAVADFMNPDRIVIGGIDVKSREVVQSLYAAWPDALRIFTNNATAEMIKYASNSLLATMISFSNEIGRLCSALGGVDVADVLTGVHQSAYLTRRLPDGERVTAPLAAFLGAGCGFGGSCLPKDVSALVAHGKSHGLRMPLLSSVLEINREQPGHFVTLADRHYRSLAGVKVAVLGVAFKPDTDDVRESPAFPVITLLKERGAAITVYDPVARPAAHPVLAGVALATSLAEAVADAEVVFLVTRWEEFAELPEVLRRLGREPLVVDGRRQLHPEDFSRFEGVGR